MFTSLLILCSIIHSALAVLTLVRQISYVMYNTITFKCANLQLALWFSDQYGGDAESRAAAISKGTDAPLFDFNACLDPLEWHNLSLLPYDIYDNIALIHGAAEDADHQSFKREILNYPPEGEQGKALEVGRVKNLYTMSAQFKCDTD